MQSIKSSKKHMLTSKLILRRNYYQISSSSTHMISKKSKALLISLLLITAKCQKTIWWAPFIKLCNSIKVQDNSRTSISSNMGTNQHSIQLLIALLTITIMGEIAGGKLDISIYKNYLNNNHIRKIQDSCSSNRINKYHNQKKPIRILRIT